MPNIPFFLELIWRRRSHWNRYRKISSVNVCKTLKCPFCMFIFFFQTKNANKYWKKAIGNSSKPFINPSRILFYIRKSSPRTTGFFQFLHVSTRFYSMFFLVSFMLYVEKCSHWELKLDKIAIEISIMRIGHLFCAQLQHSVRIINEPK